MSTLDTVRGHPPTFVGAASALLASLSRDLEPLVASLPVISEATGQLLLVLVAGVVGGALGKWAERYTVPYRDTGTIAEVPEDERLDEDGGAGSDAGGGNTDLDDVYDHPGDVVDLDDQ